MNRSFFVRGDIDGFFGLAVDNLVQLLLIDALCRNVLGFWCILGRTHPPRDASSGVALDARGHCPLVHLSWIFVPYVCSAARRHDHVRSGSASLLRQTHVLGHPAWKAMGARSGYSVLNAAFFVLLLLSGALPYVTWAVPVDAGMAIAVWIGIVITAQAFSATPRRHAPAVVMGLLPGVGAWGALMAKTGLRAAGVGTLERPFGPDLVEVFARSDTWIVGAFSLEQGFIFTAMIFAAVTSALIDRRFLAAGLWCFSGAALSLLGLMHSFRYTVGDTVLSMTPALPWAVGYACMGALFLLAPYITMPAEKADAVPDANGDDQ